MAFIIYTEFIFTNYYLCQIKDYFYQNKLYLHFFLYLQIQAFFIWDLQSCRISSLITHSLRHPWLSHNETILQSRKSTGGKGLTAAPSYCISCPTSFAVSFLIIYFFHPLPLGNHLQLKTPLSLLILKYAQRAICYLWVFELCVGFKSCAFPAFITLILIDYECGSNSWECQT